MAYTNTQRPELRLAVGAEAAGASLDAAHIAIQQLEPLLRGLLLAGYEAQTIDIGIGSANGGAPAAWTSIDLPTMEVQAASSVGGAWPAQARLTVRLQVRERWSLTQQSFAIGLSLVSGNLGGAGQGETRTLEYSTQNPAGDYSELSAALSSFGVDADLEVIAEELEARWNHTSGADGLNPLTFTLAPGLLWLFYPQHWYREPTILPPAKFIHDQALKLAEAIGDDALGFFRRQIALNHKHDETAAASLRGVSERTTGVQAQLFFFSVADLNRGLDSPMSDEWFYNLSGPGTVGHPSTVRYLEVILHLAEAGLFPFPAFVDSDNPSHFDFEDPLETWIVKSGADEVGVGISVFGSEPMEILRAVDIGYEMERCFAWEYRDADESGLAHLVVVAGPGVWISGEQNIAGLLNFELRIYRVQDPDLIPAWGERIYEQFLWASHDHGRCYWNSIVADDMPAADDDLPTGPQPAPAAGAYGVAAFRVQQRPDGVRINYPAEKSDDESELIIDLKVDPTSPFHRFTYDIQEGEGQMGDRQRQVVRVWATEGVEITVVHDFAIGVAIDEHYWRLREPPIPQGGVFDGRTLREMPMPGVTLPVDMPPTHLDPVMLQQGDLNYGRTHLPDVLFWIGAAKFVGQMAVDIGIGFTPVGDVVDLLDFTQSWVTGKDKWGNPVTNFDRALMLAGVLPFVSSGALRAATRTRGAL